MNEEMSGVWLAVAGGILGAVVGTFGGVVGATNGRHIQRGEPNLLEDKRWNLLDWFSLTTLVLGIGYAVFAVMLSHLWSTAMGGLVLFGGLGFWGLLTRYRTRQKGKRQ